MKRRRRTKNVAMIGRMAELGLTGSELARMAHVSPFTVSLTLNQRTDPKPETAERLAAALGTTPGAMGWAVQS